jgi:mycoredoxin
LHGKYLPAHWLHNSNSLADTARRIKNMTTQTFTMYSTQWCGYCKRLKSDLQRAGIEFTEIDIEHDAESAALVEKANNGNQTVPTLIFTDGTSMTNPSLAKIKEHLGL